MSKATWRPIDESFGPGERLDLGDVLVAWVDPVRTRPGEPDPTAEWTGKSLWCVGYEDGGEPCEPLADGHCDTRDEARRAAAGAAYAMLASAMLDALKAARPEDSGARPAEVHVP